MRPAWQWCVRSLCETPSKIFVYRRKVHALGANLHETRLRFQREREKHLLSRQAKKGLGEDNPLERAGVLDDPETTCWPIGELSQGKGVFEIIKGRGAQKGDKRRLTGIDDFGPEVSKNPWLEDECSTLRQPSYEKPMHTDLIIIF